MAHRAAIYTVGVRPKRKKDEDDYRLLGDIDEQGASLAATIREIGNGLRVRTGEGTTRVGCTRCTRDGDEVFMMLTHGQSGVVADIFDAADRLALHQEADMTQEVKCGVLFQLPGAQKMGWLAAHVNAGRSAKGLMEKGLVEGFRAEHPELVLEINPSVSAQALKQAAETNRIEKVKLVKLVPPADRARALTDNWVRGDTVGKLELDITSFALAAEDGPGRRGRLRERLQPGLLLRYFRGERDAAFNAMVEFVGGLRFDQVKFEVVTPSGAHRTYNIEHPESGHAITEDLRDLRFRDDVPTETSLRASLRAAIPRAHGEP
jgi:hypothetical protein